MQVTNLTLVPAQNPASQWRPDRPVPLDREIWLADLTHTGRGVASDTVPLAVGYIGAYLGSWFEMPRPVRLFRYPKALAEALETSPRRPDLVGFSNYLWNAELSRWFARRIKQRWPGCVTVFGGPNLPLVAGERDDYLRDLREVDFYVAKEGEIPFAALTRVLHENDWRIDAARAQVPSTYSIGPDGVVHGGVAVPRMRELDDIPSPYLNGSMDEFLDGYLVPSVQTNRGCPFTCSFCLEGDRYYTKVHSFSAERVLGELEYIGQRMRGPITAKGRNELNITDSNFGMFPQDAEICAAIGRCVDRFGWPAQVNVTTGKNRRERVLSSIRQARGTIQLSGAVQSLDENVLANVNRSNIKTADLIGVARDAAKNATRTYSDVILGLPGDTLEAHVQTVSQLVDGGFGRVNLFQFALLLGAQINNRDVREKFGMRTAYRVIPRAFGRYRLFGESGACAEIDEVAVGSDTLTYEDYIAAREYDLCVFLFHNDAIMAGTEAALGAAGVPGSAWLREIWQSPWSGRLGEIRSTFAEQTAGQLFPSRAAAAEHLTSDIESYLAGTAGNNVLYSARGRALQEAVDELAVTAREAALRLVPGQADAARLLRQAAEFDRLSLSGVLEHAHLEEQLRGWFDFDFEALLRDRPTTVAAIRLATPRRFCFTLSDAVRETVDAYRYRMGDDGDGLGRALSRIRLNDLRRLAQPETLALAGQS